MMKLSERRKREKIAKSKDKRVSILIADMPKQVDALFVGLSKLPGHVVAMVSPYGREAVNKVFPDCHIAWTAIRSDMPNIPEDWREFDFVVPGLIKDLRANGLPHGLPEHLIKLIHADGMSPDQCAFLMLSAANKQGVRAGMISETSGEAQVIYPENSIN